MSASIADSLLRNIPELIAWGTGMVLAVLMVRRGGDRVEKLFLSGCSLMFISTLASPFLRGLIYHLASQPDTSHGITAQTLGWASMPLGILGLAAFVCLVIAFWARFWRRKKEPA